MKIKIQVIIAKLVSNLSPSSPNACVNAHKTINTTTIINTKPINSITSNIYYYSLSTTPVLNNGVFANHLGKFVLTITASPLSIRAKKDFK